MALQKPSIDVLLATYKSDENFVAQLDSLAKQAYKDFNLIVRDDAGDHRHRTHIQALSEDISGKVFLLDDSLGKLGTAGNFSRLLEESNSDYVMLCDQDDVWMPTKVEATLARMQAMERKYGKDVPLLVHTDLQVVNDDLEMIAESLWQHQNIHPSNREVFNRLLVQNVITGCTVMINKALRNIALPIPDQAAMHDWWLALVASAFGHVGHLDQATILYRQHESNEVGAKEWGVPFVLQNILGNRGQVRESIAKQQRQARAFVESYQDKLDDDLRSVAECYATLDQQMYLKRIWLLIRHRLFKAGFTRNVGLWTHI